MSPRVRGVIAHVGLGSNLGDRLGHLRAAVSALGELGIVSARSSVWETAPVDSPPGAGDFLNAVVALETPLTPAALLEALLAIETRAGRTREGGRNAPRTLDLDLLLCGDLVLPGPGGPLVPHPRLAERAFVLAPLCEIAPAARHPLMQCSMSELLARLGGLEGVRRVSEGWDHRR